jgi:hypothetical protein
MTCSSAVIVADALFLSIAALPAHRKLHEHVSPRVKRSQIIKIKFDLSNGPGRLLSAQEPASRGLRTHVATRIALGHLVATLSLLAAGGELVARPGGIVGRDLEVEAQGQQPPPSVRDKRI